MHCGILFDRRLDLTPWTSAWEATPFSDTVRCPFQMLLLRMSIIGWSGYQSFVLPDQGPENESSGSISGMCYRCRLRLRREPDNRILVIQLTAQSVCIYSTCLKWMLPKLPFSDLWSMGTKLWERNRRYRCRLRLRSELDNQNSATVKTRIQEHPFSGFRLIVHVYLAANSHATGVSLKALVSRLRVENFDLTPAHICGPISQACLKNVSCYVLLDTISKNMPTQTRVRNGNHV